jgi:acyl-coenzyme A thioesterase PaaI-like protein
MDTHLNLGLVAHLGIDFIEASPERVVAELGIREEVCTLVVRSTAAL